MSIALEFYDNGVILRHSGIITDEELIQAENDIYDHEYPEQLQFQIIDLAEVEAFQASDETMRYLGQKDHAQSKIRNHQFVVVIAPMHCRTKTMIWEVWAQDKDSREPTIFTEIVNTTEEAIKWLEGNRVNVSFNKTDEHIGL